MGGQRIQPIASIGAHETFVAKHKSHQHNVAAHPKPHAHLPKHLWYEERVLWATWHGGTVSIPLAFDNEMAVGEFAGANLGASGGYFMGMPGLAGPYANEFAVADGVRILDKSRCFIAVKKGCAKHARAFLHHNKSRIRAEHFQEVLVHPIYPEHLFDSVMADSVNGHVMVHPQFITLAWFDIADSQNIFICTFGSDS